MIPDIQSCLLCEDVRQERNGKFILIGLIDAVQVPRLPVRFGKLCMVTRWCSGEGEFLQASKIYKPDQTSVMVTGKDIPVKLPNPQCITTNVEIFLNVTFESEGTHWVEIALDKDLKLRYPIGVHLAKPKNAPPSAPGAPGTPPGGTPTGGTPQPPQFT